MDKEELSACEAMIMKVIWDARQDISIPELTVRLKERFQKDYVRTTIVTYLLRLSDKGFVSTYRKGRLAYAHAEKSEAQYKANLAKKQTDFWFDGRVSDFVASLCQTKHLAKEDADRLRRLLDEEDGD